MYDYSDQEMIAVLKHIRKLWDRKVTAADGKIVEDLFLEYGFDFETVCYLMDFVKGRGAERLKYVYPVADVLKNQNIHGKSGAEIFLERKFSRYKPLMKAMNLFRTIPEKKEKEIIDQWYEKYAEADIKEACILTGKKAKYPSIAYADAILRAKEKTDKKLSPG